MDFERADEIRIAWGKFLENYHSKLMKYFHSSIPESFLPYPKKDIQQALEILANEFEAEGDSEAARTMHSTDIWLTMYVDDREALEVAGKNFSNPKYLDAVLKIKG